MHSSAQTAAVVQPGLSALLHHAATSAQRIASTERAVAALPGLQRGHALVAAQAGARGRVPARTLRAVVRAVHSDGPIMIPDVASPLPIPDLQLWPRGVSSLAAVPLCPEERGGCLLVTSAAPREFTRGEMEALAVVAAQTTQAIGYLHQATAVRDHLARELHDTVTQTLTLLAFSLDELLAATHDHPSHAVAAIARAHATSALVQVRHLMGHADSGDGVLARLQRIVLELTRAGIEVCINGTLSDDSPYPTASSTSRTKR